MRTSLRSWHALAKLRMHTDETLKLLEIITERLGKLLRCFQLKTRAAFDTQELKQETQRRQRRKAGNLSGTATASTSKAARRPKAFNLQTYKLYALGDYSSSIRKYGTADSYSTESASAVMHVRCPPLLTWQTRRAQTPYLQGKVSSN